MIFKTVWLTIKVGSTSLWFSFWLENQGWRLKKSLYKIFNFWPVNWQVKKYYYENCFVIIPLLSKIPNEFMLHFGIPKLTKFGPAESLNELQMQMKCKYWGQYSPIVEHDININKATNMQIPTFFNRKYNYF